MHEKRTLTVSAVVNAPIERVWERWTDPAHIPGWAFASDDWEAPHAENDLCVGGKFKTRMQAKDGSAGFDFTGAYVALKTHELIEYDMEDGRRVKTTFTKVPNGVLVTEVFDPENENPDELQLSGWQAILENFKKYAESR